MILTRLIVGILNPNVANVQMKEYALQPLVLLFNIYLLLGSGCHCGLDGN